MADHLITSAGTWQIHASGDAGDVVCLLTELHAEPIDGPLVALSRQQVVARLGRGVPSDFPAPDVMIGDPEQGATRGWWESTVQNYLAGTPPTAAEDENAAAADLLASAPAEEPENSGHWARRSRQWDDVEYSGADRRVLIATSRGIVTPAGAVVSRPFESPDHLGKLVSHYQWSVSDEETPQVWMFPEALEAIGFPIDGLVPDDVPDVVAAFFGCEVTYHKAGWFTCKFTADGKSCAAEVVLLPFLPMEPSPSRPNDRGLAGIDGTDTELPDDEVEAAHLLADRVEWLFELDGALAAPRWSQVGGRLAAAAIKRSKPKSKNNKTAPPLTASPLPKEITTNGRLPSQWWGPGTLKKPHRTRAGTIDVELDQQSAYLPSAEGIYLGYGKPGWSDVDPAVFGEQHPPFGMFFVTTPAGRDLDGLSPKLPLPHPAMLWDKPATFWATTVDVKQLTAPAIQGGAGIAAMELAIDAAWVWPEQHQWLKGWAGALRSKMAAARAAGRGDYEEMIKAIYTSFLGRLSAGGDSAWKYPLLKFQQPAWYAAIEAVTRWRALRYATQIAADHTLYPIEVLADAWFYRVPADFAVTKLETPLRPDGNRANGSYRIKHVEEPEAA